MVLICGGVPRVNSEPRMTMRTVSRLSRFRLSFVGNPFYYLITPFVDEDLLLLLLLETNVAGDGEAIVTVRDAPIGSQVIHKTRYHNPATRAKPCAKHDRGPPAH